MSAWRLTELEESDVIRCVVLAVSCALKFALGSNCCKETGPRDHARAANAGRFPSDSLSAFHRRRIVI